MTALLLSLISLGTRVVYQDLPCPIGDDIVRVYQFVSGNSLGGYDSDLASYSSQGQFREYGVATCAENLFSLPVNQMQNPIDAAMHDQLLAALAEEVAALPDPDEPTVWQRYGIAARMLKELGGSTLEQAELYLQASWTARDTVVGYHQGLTGPGAVSTLMALGAEELKKPLTDEQRRAILYTLARAAHRGGLSTARNEFLKQFEALDELSTGDQAAITEFRNIATTVEPHYQDLAIGAFQASLLEGISAESRIRTTYLIADLMRRRGRYSEARPLYEAVLSNEGTPPNIREMAELLVSELPSR